MVDADQLREILDEQYEWLLVRESGRSFALTRREIAIDSNGGSSDLRFLDDDGTHAMRLGGFSLEGSELIVDLVGASDEAETIRLVPRVAASTLSAEVELARMEKANEIARIINDTYPGVKIGRVALNAENGRLAQIEFQTEQRSPASAIADITAALTAEAVLTAAILWLEKLGSRKYRPVLDIWVIAEKRHAGNLQKLHALLTDKWKSKIHIFAIDRKTNPPRLKEMPKRRVRELFREKASKLAITSRADTSGTAAAIAALSPDQIDMIYTRNGETIRFRGLPFARVRTVAGVEKAWFGIGRDRRILTRENWADLESLVGELENNRTPAAANRRHEHYRTAPEAWLESILRRDITLLDANLILSPLYNQFRFSNDRIDLLALRRDGRLAIIELKTQPDREMLLQAADYWRKIELQRRRGILAAADLFDGREIIDKPAIVYLAAPAWSFHRDFEFFARIISPEIEIWRFELHEKWREAVKVLARHNYSETEVSSAGRTNR